MSAGIIHVMPVSITIRDIPDDTRDELAARAARNGKSLQEYLRGEMIESTRRPDVAALLDRSSHRKRQTRSELSPDQIVAHIEAGRR